MTRNVFTIQIRGRNHLLGPRTWIMGILNVTPDSFSDGGLYFDPKKAVARGLEMAAEGADIIDIGGESTRPGSLPVPEDEELRRVVPIIRELRAKTDVLLSADTTKASIAEAAFEAGADILNDQSALRFDPGLAAAAARRRAPVILMHMQGTPLTMQKAPFYKDVLSEVRDFLKERLEAALAAGIPGQGLIVDPGIGFGKRPEDNYTLIRNLDALAPLGRPVCIGISRKSFIGRILDVGPLDRLEGTIAAAVLSLAGGAHILRVHDVRAVRRAAAVADAILGREPAPPAWGEKKTPYVC